MKVSHILVKNFKSFEFMELDLRDFSVLVGQNGAGKSNFLSIFSFLSDCISVGDVNTVVGQIGIEHLCHNGNTGIPVEIALTFCDADLHTVHYSIKIAYNQGRAVVEDEQLTVSERVNGEEQGAHEFYNRRGVCRRSDGTDRLKDSDVALSIFGRLLKYRGATAVYNYLKGVYPINFALPELRAEACKCSRRLSYRGNNLKSVALEMQNNFPESFNAVVKHMQCALGVNEIRLQKLPTGNIALTFTQGDKVISEAEISDGMLSLFAYYVLLEHPLKSSMLCIEEPERNISPNCLVQLAEVMRVKAHAENTQILVTTHSSEFISALQLGEVFYASMENNNTVITTRYTS